MQDLKVLLIGGPPGAGKTTLSRAAAAELGFASLTVDDLVVAARVLTNPESHPELHQMRPVGHTRYFTEGPPERLISDAVALEQMMWSPIQRVIRSHTAAKSPTVIDWWLLSPQKVAELDDEAIASVWLHFDPDALGRRERLNVEFWAPSSDPEQMFSHFMERSLWRNELVASQAREEGMPVIHQSGEETIEDLVATTLRMVGNEGADS